MLNKITSIALFFALLVAMPASAGNNFYTKWVDGTTVFSVASMDPALAGLDKGITYLKNPIVHCDGKIWWDKSKLYWDGTISILFNRADGQAILNTIAANTSGLTVNDNQFVYVDLNETNNTALTATAATVTTGSASNFLTVARLVLGYRNTSSDEFFSPLLQTRVAVKRIVSQSLTKASFTDNTDATGYIDITTQIPANSIVLGWKAVVSAGFTGNTSATIQVGLAGALDKYSASTAGSVYATGTVGSSVKAGNVYEPSAVTIRVTVTGASDFTNISAGTMVVTVFYIEC